ncbi:MAG: LuxR C-terminal-related transcriptional regulator [Brevibacterium sp.]|nr:LuxR C-terminal-related transcriptional regulator [Brevibacterium sp.]MDN6133297.1 LuxR C-terminal-related transcriptional regulator [Brevibacterium sp.]MDN6156738.1 LuxR C-terminal-related transcriptional regulator [Brevibacterium sp.]MDN6176462.1 LuxR C-terminal-related transcriptional regulator [Brevibacterium sp.]MDN6189985.1 LuxR C-terminal-related transcriptional regulator [Brevibacterium sp.]
MTHQPSYRRPPIFGRADELRTIEESLTDSSLVGVLIEGDVGMGKTRLAREVHRRRGGQGTWLQADRVLSETPFGVFGMIVDLDEPGGLTTRVIAAVTGGRHVPTVFVDDAHYLDEHSLRMLTQLAAERAIRLVALTRHPQDDEFWPFADLVDEQMLAQMVLEPLTPADLRTAVEYSFGGIAAQGALDIIDFHSGRNPGKLLELLDYCRRKNRLLSRKGVLVLDGLDIDFDVRARDFARIDLEQYSTEEQEALELVVMAGEIDIDLMLSVGLGSAADRLVDVDELRIVGDTTRVYVAREHHASETIRYSAPIGRSRKWYGMVRGYPDHPTQRSQMLRTEWALGCGASVDEQQVIDAAMIAIETGEWHRALRIMSDVSTDRLSAPELYELAYLYCNVGQVALGLDLLAHCLHKACCPGLVIAAAVLWGNRQVARQSVALEAADFTAALDRIAAHKRDCCHDESCHRDEKSLGQETTRRFAAEALGDATARTLLLTVQSIVGFHDQQDGDLLRQHALDASLPDVYRTGAAAACGSLKLEQGRVEQADDLLTLMKRQLPETGMGTMFIRMLDARVLMEQGDLDAARRSLQVPLTSDIAYIAAQSGTSDMIAAEISLLEGNLDASLRLARASVEALDHWNQTSLLASALGVAQYVATLSGETDMAEAFDIRFARVADSGLKVESRRALAFTLISRWLRTSDPESERQLRQLLDDSEREQAHGLSAHIRHLLFRHLGEVDVAEMRRLSSLGEGRAFRFLGAVGEALWTKDAAALLRIADAERRSAPDIAARCVQMAKDRLHHRGSVPLSRGSYDLPVELTEREREICGFLVKGKSNAEIADLLGAAVRTVEGHAYRLYRKLGVTRRHQVAEALARLNIEALGAAKQETHRS